MNSLITCRRKKNGFQNTRLIIDGPVLIMTFTFTIIEKIRVNINNGL